MLLLRGLPSRWPQKSWHSSAYESACPPPLVPCLNHHHPLHLKPLPPPPLQVPCPSPPAPSPVQLLMTPAMSDSVTSPLELSSGT